MPFGPFLEITHVRSDHVPLADLMPMVFGWLEVEEFPVEHVFFFP